jgi:hypothetical protein
MRLNGPEQLEEHQGEPEEAPVWTLETLGGRSRARALQEELLRRAMLLERTHWLAERDEARRIASVQERQRRRFNTWSKLQLKRHFVAELGVHVYELMWLALGYNHIVELPDNIVLIPCGVGDIVYAVRGSLVEFPFIVHRPEEQKSTQRLIDQCKANSQSIRSRGASSIAVAA